MIDIHCHILPGIDDGASDLQTALKMAKVAAKDGIRTIVATPHCFDGVYDCQNLDISDHCRKLNRELSSAGIGVEVVPGAEVRLTPEFLDLFGRDQVPFLGQEGSAILLELPEMFIIDSVIRIIKILRKKKVRCILAHPERNTLLLTKRSVLPLLVEAGASLQLTAGSVTGDFGREIKNYAWELLEKGYPVYLASDAHCHRRRKPLLGKAKKRVEKKFGKEVADNLVDCEFIGDRMDMEERTIHQFG